MAEAEVSTSGRIAAKLAHSIREAIAEGTYRVGEYLPGVRQLGHCNGRQLLRPIFGNMCQHEPHDRLPEQFNFVFKRHSFPKALSAELLCDYAHGDSMQSICGQPVGTKCPSALALRSGRRD